MVLTWKWGISCTVHASLQADTLIGQILRTSNNCMTAIQGHHVTNKDLDLGAMHCAITYLKARRQDFGTCMDNWIGYDG